MNKTIFLQIINRQMPAHIVYEDDICISILDISQVTKGHTLVIPKTPYRNIFDIDSEVLAHLIKVVKKIAISMKSALNVEAVNIVNNSGPLSGQTVDHFHIHILPRHSKEEYGYRHDNNLGKYTNEELKSIQENISNNL